MTTIHTTHGVYTGRSVETIIRREYGRKASVRWTADANNPAAGMIVEWVRADGDVYNVLATLHRVDDETAVPDTTLTDAVADVRSARGDMDTALATRAQAIRAARTSGTSVPDLVAITGLDRSLVYRILDES